MVGPIVQHGTEVHENAREAFRRAGNSISRRSRKSARYWEIAPVGTIF